jgi:hypothetical protein
VAGGSGVGVVGKRGMRRSVWCENCGVSGSIERDMGVGARVGKMCEKKSGSGSLAVTGAVEGVQWRVAVVLGSLERGDRGGQFETKIVVVVAVLSELWAVVRMSTNFVSTSNRQGKKKTSTTATQPKTTTATCIWYHSNRPALSYRLPPLPPNHCHSLSH